jgi:hypothetical protein
MPAMKSASCPILLVWVLSSQDADRKPPKNQL